MVAVQVEPKERQDNRENGKGTRSVKVREKTNDGWLPPPSSFFSHTWLKGERERKMAAIVAKWNSSGIIGRIGRFDHMRNIGKSHQRSEPDGCVFERERENEQEKKMTASRRR